VSEVKVRSSVIGKGGVIPKSRTLQCHRALADKSKWEGIALGIKEDVRFGCRIGRSEYDKFRAWWLGIEEDKKDCDRKKGHEREREAES
jgi:hypothetical protein